MERTQTSTKKERPARQLVAGLLAVFLFTAAGVLGVAQDAWADVWCNGCWIGDGEHLITSSTEEEGCGPTNRCLVNYSKITNGHCDGEYGAACKFSPGACSLLLCTPY